MQIVLYANEKLKIIDICKNGDFIQINDYSLYISDWLNLKNLKKYNFTWSKCDLTYLESLGIILITKDKSPKYNMGKILFKIKKSVNWEVFCDTVEKTIDENK